MVTEKDIKSYTHFVILYNILNQNYNSFSNIQKHNTVKKMTSLYINAHGTDIAKSMSKKVQQNADINRLFQKVYRKET